MRTSCHNRSAVRSRRLHPKCLPHARCPRKQHPPSAQLQLELHPHCLTGTGEPATSLPQTESPITSTDSFPFHVRGEEGGGGRG